MTARVELVPTLDRCIETTAREEYQKSLRQLLAGTDASRVLSDRLELLVWFLSNADFRKLRSETERHLINGKRVSVLLYEEDGIRKYRIEVTAD